jgi:hypothetical protein
MAAPCKKCGATKTEPVRKSLRKRVARSFGYDLRRCARCRKFRLIDREQNERQNNRLTLLLADEDPPYGTPPNPSVYRDSDAFHGCPRCGAWNYHRSPRGWFERVFLGRPPMLRCYTCKFRFPSPQF